jgi:hypothetical protein
MYGLRMDRNLASGTHLSGHMRCDYRYHVVNVPKQMLSRKPWYYCAVYITGTSSVAEELWGLDYFSLSMG